MVSFTSKLLKSTDPDTVIQFQFKETRGNKTSKEKKKKRESKPSLFQEAGEESHSLLSPASESSKHSFILFVSTFFFWMSSCCLSRSSWIWMSTACSSLVTESSSSLRATREEKRYNGQTELITILGFLMIDFLGIPHYQLHKLKSGLEEWLSARFGATQTGGIS